MQIEVLLSLLTVGQEVLPVLLLFLTLVVLGLVGCIQTLRAGRVADS